MKKALHAALVYLVFFQRRDRNEPTLLLIVSRLVEWCKIGDAVIKASQFINPSTAQ